MGDKPKAPLHSLNTKTSRRIELCQQITVEAVLLAAIKRQKAKTTKHKRDLLPRDRVTRQDDFSPRELLLLHLSALKHSCSPAPQANSTSLCRLQNQGSLIHTWGLHLLRWRHLFSTHSAAQGHHLSVQAFAIHTQHLVQMCGAFAQEGFRNARDERKDGERVQPHPQDATRDP